MSEHIVGRITRIFGKGQQANRWFAGIIRFSDGHDERIAGTASTTITVGTTVECEADYIKTDYGWQYVPIKGSLISRVFTTRFEVVRFLSSDLFPGVGKGTAEKLYDAYGSDIMEILNNNLADAAKKCHLNKVQVESLMAGLRSTSAVVALAKAFPHMRPTTAQRLVDQHRSVDINQMIGFIQKNPYSVLNLDYGLTLRETDEIAIEDCGASMTSRERIEFIVYYAIGKFCVDKHATYVRLDKQDELEYFFREYICKLRLYGEIPLYMNGRLFDANYLVYFISAVLVGSSKSLLAIAEFEENGVKEAGLYQAKMLHAEQQLAGMLANAYCKLDPSYMTRYAKFQKYLKHIKTKLKNEGGLWELSDEQDEALGMVFRNRICFISGGPGRGKTKLIKELINAWCGVVGTSVIALAPTGKAVNRMKGQTGRSDVETVARFLVVNAKVSGGHVQNVHGDIYDTHPSTLIVVDEASMLNFVTAYDLLKMVAGCTVVFVGDKDQLPPIEPGAFLTECLASQRRELTMLTKNFRTDSLTLNENSDKVVRGESIKSMTFDDSFMIMGYDENSANEGELSPAEQFILTDYKQHLATGDFSDILLVSPFATSKYRLSAGNLNKMLQNALNPLNEHNVYHYGHDDYGQFYDLKGKYSGILDSDGLQIRVGDRVMNTKNNMELSWQSFRNDNVWSEKDLIEFDDQRNIGIFNGDVGTVIRVYEPVERRVFSVLIELDDGRNETERQRDPQPKRYVCVEADVDNNGAYHMKDWCLGYALSVHKAQGSEASHVIVALSEAGYRATVAGTKYHDSMPFLTRNMLYTALTRAKDSVVVVGSVEAFNACLKTPYEYTNVRLAQAIDEFVV